MTSDVYCGHVATNIAITSIKFCSNSLVWPNIVLVDIDMVLSHFRPSSHTSELLWIMKLLEVSLPATTSPENQIFA